ncbi:MAG TPA: MFS transporter [Gaiella sp.]|jgi:MFS family permease|nr:MFS transporter [Gaiella sp.]
MRMRTAIGGRLVAVRELWGNRDLRRAELAWGGFHAAEWASLVALSVVAFEADGAAAVGLVLFARMVPSAFVAPFVAVVGDRYRRERILIVVHLVRALACLGAAVALVTDADPLVVYVLAILAAVPLAAHRPCHLALAPLLARTPRELAASNVAALTFESTAVLLGPAVAALLLAVSSPAAVFTACAAASFLSFVAIAGVRPSAMIEAAGERLGVVHELREGGRALMENPPVRLVVALFGAQAFVRGALGVILVVLAIDLLGIGESGVGLLTAAFGVGGILGALAGISLVGRGRLGRPFQLSLAGWGLPLVLIGVWPESAVAITCLALSGLANSLLDVSGFTSMQEHVDEKVIGRVFGLFELVVIAAVAIGSLVAPLAIEVLGTRGALIAAGGLLAILAALAHRSLGRIDDGMEVRAAELELLQRTSVFGPLPYAALRRLASSLGERHAAAGEVIVRQGDDGDLVYVIAQGRVTVTRDGELLRELGPAEVFGELALILDVPRTATVTATEPVELRTLGRERFLATVTGNQLSHEALRRLVAARTPAELAATR